MRPTRHPHPPPLLLPLALALALALLSAAIGVHAAYDETLLLRRLPEQRKVLAHFDFVVDEREDGAADAGASRVPLVLEQILTAYDAHSLHLTIALGKYSHARYGPARVEGIGPDLHAPFGARLHVQLLPHHKARNVSSNGVSQHALTRWRGITSELGGVFSASLNQMDETVVTTPLSDGAPRDFGAYIAAGTAEDDAACPSCTFLHGALAREEICTENLTPWLKMLPCRSRAGLGKLIDPIKFLSGEYLALSVYAARSRADGRIRIEQQLTTVQSVANSEDWSLASVLFDGDAANRESITACPLARSSTIRTETIDRRIAQEASVIDLKQGPVSATTRWTQGITTSEDVEEHGPRADAVAVHRFVTGHGQVHGGVAVRLENNHGSCAMRVTYQDVLPWYLRVYWSTFRAKVVLDRGEETVDGESYIRSNSFVPAELRGHPNQLRLELLLPARSAFVMSIQFEKVFLRLSEHPPDANRGFDVPPGVASFDMIANSDDSCAPLSEDLGAFARTLYTEPLLVPLPTPDFSMPYNVITMTSTVVAFFVGSMLNTLLRKAPRIQQMMAKNTKQ